VNVVPLAATVALTKVGAVLSPAGMHIDYKLIGTIICLLLCVNTHVASIRAFRRKPACVQPKCGGTSIAGSAATSDDLARVPKEFFLVVNINYTRGSPGMTADDFKIVADARIDDALTLLAASRWSAAYYLLGYAVECALKACAARQFHEHELPDKIVVQNFYTHELVKLLNISGVKSALEEKTTHDAAFAENWSFVRNSWDVDTRYDHSRTEAETRDLLRAITDPGSGVLSWLKTQW
jgi:hypothetical protein